MQWNAMNLYTPIIPRHNWSTSQPTTSPARPAFLQQPQHQALLSRRGCRTAARYAALSAAWVAACHGAWRAKRDRRRVSSESTWQSWWEHGPGRSRHVPAWSGERWVRNLHITIKRISATNVKILIYGMGLHFWFSVICSEGHYYQLCWWQGTSVSTLAIFWGWKIWCDYWLLWTTKLWLYCLRVKKPTFRSYILQSVGLVCCSWCGLPSCPASFGGPNSGCLKIQNEAPKSDRSRILLLDSYQGSGGEFWDATSETPQVERFPDSTWPHPHHASQMTPASSMTHNCHNPWNKGCFCLLYLLLEPNQVTFCFRWRHTLCNCT